MAPPRPGPHSLQADEVSIKGAARAAREDGARGATAPPALAKGQAQRHLSAFQPSPTPQDPAFGATRGAGTAPGPRTLGPSSATAASRRSGAAARAPQELPGRGSSVGLGSRRPGGASGPVPPASARRAPGSPRRGCPQKRREEGSPDEK